MTISCWSCLNAHQHVNDEPAKNTYTDIWYISCNGQPQFALKFHGISIQQLSIVCVHWSIYIQILTFTCYVNWIIPNLQSIYAGYRTTFNIVYLLTFLTMMFYIISIRILVYFSPILKHNLHFSEVFVNLYFSMSSSLFNPHHFGAVY